MERLSEKLKNVLDDCIDSISEFQQDILDVAINFLSNAENILGDDYDLDRLRDLVEADKDGRCFISDVKLGGEVFYIPKFNGKPYCGIREGHVQAVSFTKVGKRIKIREYHAHNQDFMLGKAAFLTYEAAEAALKGEQHERG